jgi:hypothetical protein
MEMSEGAAELRRRRAWPIYCSLGALYRSRICALTVLFHHVLAGGEAQEQSAAFDARHR